ncbi:MAG: hypothetical protein F4047_00870 [Caldilineaceae bacterium SB0670_bin_27]|uniref:GerMN domain-containing protein n=1 Tax=Caldilineaceae bacterium SB0664_bin_27 TaxID=2605260 RepID=A0A6B0YRL3_9CHLR|nr:hypothetical protein [Caldilineaceae bacterium SB0664_bin_27]MYJ76730.1 hypothetical protein [Caldilineaceae bacterium SB0670_bin_27]
MQKRVTYWAVLSLVVAFVFSGCTARVDAGSMAERGPDEFYVDLPPIVIDYAPDGTASVGGLSHMVVGNVEKPPGMVYVPEPGVRLGLATVLYGLSLPSLWVQHFTASDLQHLRIANGDEGILIYANGQRIPSLVWEEEGLAATGEAVNVLGLGVPALNKVLPLVRNFDLGVVLRFPLQEGAELIPLGGVEESEEVTMARMLQQQVLETFGGALPTIDIPILYHADGSWTLGELSDVDWTVLTSTPFYALRLPPELISGLTDSGIYTVTLTTDPDGIHIALNGIGLPYLSWGSGEVQNVLALTKQLGVFDSVSALVPGADMASVLSLVENLLPIIQATNANITIYLPGSEMGN